MDPVSYTHLLILIIGGVIAIHLIPIAIFSPERFLFPLLIVGHQMVRRVQNPACGTIILFQANHLRPGKVDVYKRQIYRLSILNEPHVNNK